MGNPITKPMARDIWIGVVLICIGLLAALGIWMNSIYSWTESGYFIGITFGGLGGGIGTLVSPLLARNNQEARKNYELQHDERLVFIKQKSKTTAYQFAFYGLAAATFFSSMSDWPAWIVCTVLLIGVTLVQVTALIVYACKY